MTTVQTARLGGRLTLLAALFGALGCSSPATTAAVSGTDTAGGFDIQLSDVTVTGADTAKGDAAEDGDGSSDATGSDSGADIQGDTATLCGSAGCPCAGNGDCDSGFCIEVGGQNECAALCVTGCEPGFQCTQTTSSTGDIASLCTPLFGRLCEPCQADADCSNVLGGKDNRCVAYSGAAGSLLGQFCAAPCGPSGDCPSGYACQDTKSVGGVLGKQCLRVNGSCECDARAQKLGLATPCSSGNAAGTCKGSRACSPSGLGACDAPLAQTETCNTQDDNCNGQTDEGGSSLCDDATPCTYDNCIAGECQHPPKTGACDDGSACTSGDYCSDGMCKGNALSCDDSNGCTADSCNPLSGCVNLPTTASCSDGDACTSGDACKDGQCVPGPATLCDDGNPCTADSCNPKQGCATSPNSDACDDNNACTTGDTCAAGKCSGGTGVVCNDGNPCTTDACDSKQGCIATPNTQGCEDGNACTTADTCAGGSCVGGPALPCDDNKPCTTDSCDPKAGCNFAPNTLPCDDGDACTQGDVCKGGSCSPGQAGPCSDGNPCTTDTCDPKGGCSSSNNTLPCDDGNACTQGDLCKSGSCTGGAALNCNDGNTCTLDSCDAAKGCQNLAAGGPCNDGNACTASDVCASGVCTAGSAIACNDGNSCTTDSCEPAKGCVFANTTAPCDDNNGCTTGDVCAAGVCKSGAGCGQNAVCAPKAGGGTACACASGYAGDGQTCTLVCPAGCTACSSPTVCTACEAGKNLVNGQCTGCVPKTCGSACGTVPNGCGKDLDCGPCTSNSIRAGNAFTCVVQVGGTVQCWGKNDLGQLGDGTYIDRWQASLTDGTPALVLGLKGVKQLALGDAHACALLGDGTIQCWGNHNYGQLGDGTAASPTGRSSPVKVSGITNAVAVTTGRWHTCALLADGTGKCWGHNVYGQLGDGTYTARNVPTPVQNLTEAAGIGAGYDFTCALFASGSVQCWGDNLFGQLGDGTTVSHNTPSPVSNLTGAASLTVSALGKFACVVEKGDTMQCWGLNANGQLGTNTSSPTKVPAPVVGLTNVKRVGAGNVHSCAALADGTVKCWGYNYYGQLGDGTTTSHPTPTAVPNLTSVIDVAGGQYHTCALHADGSVQCWGDNPSGALGNETVADSLVPVSAVNVPCGNVGTPVTCSGCVPTTCAAQKATSGTIADGCGGTLLCGVDAGKLATGTAFTCALPGDGSVRCWGQNDKGQLGDGTQRVRYQSTWVDGPPANVSGITKAIAVSAGNMHACAVLSTGKIRCWGSHSNGQLGFGGAADSAPHFDPVEVSGISTAIDVSAGHLHTCAVLADGTVKCWGYNYHGQLGDGTTSQRILPLQVGGIAGAIAVRAGYNFSCALTQAGQVKCWGDAYNGQLGSGTVSSLVPRNVPKLGGVVSLASSAMGQFTCAVLADGTAQCWGLNSYGQLGDGTNTYRTAPTGVLALKGAASISTGYYHTCARLSDGTAKCWGQNNYGQLGDTTTTSHNLPTAVANLTNVNQISAGQYHTCAALKDGTLQCWGHNNVGQVGNETSINATAAEPVANFPCGGGGTSNVCGCTPTTCQAQGAASGSISDGCGGTLLCGVPATTLAGGNNFACAVAGDGSVKCWGYNNKGQLGGNGTSSSPVPFTVPGIANAVQVSAGEGHACAVLKGGSLWCWGSHSLGQLGLGTATDNVVHPPTQVPGITNAIRISAGRQHTCAVLSDGTARCWGYNYYGQVGDGSTQTRTGPVAVLDLTGVIDIVASYNGTCALKQTGLVKCWGDNYYGQLGNGTVTFGTPMNVAKLTGVTSLGTSPQAQHACAILADGTARCWGYNGYGQLADNSTVSRNLPAVANGIAGATSISLGSNHTCATLTNGTGKCWGYNTWGQLGDGTTGNKSLPVAVSGLSGATSAALQYSASCFAVSGGGVKCAGYNLSGGLGDNTTSSKSALVPVQGMP